jgi:hypothetical protein
VCTHCRKGVEYQVQQNLLELNAIALDRQDRRREIELHGDPAPDRVGVDDAANRAEQVVEIDVGKARRFALEHVAHRLNHVAGALGDLADVRERVAHPEGRAEERRAAAFL